MPQLGETVTEGTITRWMKKVGDSVALDEILFEVSTDKVDSEVPSPAAGVLSEIVVNEGEEAEVGSVLARLSDEGSGDAPAEAPAQEAPQATAPATDVATRQFESVPQSAPQTSAPPETSVPQNFAPQTPTPEQAPAPSAEGVLLSPLVRKMVSENNIDANSISGTGVGGRITKDDVEQAIARKSQGQAPAPQAQAPQSSVPQTQPIGAAGASNASALREAGSERLAAPVAPAPVMSSGQDLVIPFDNLRRRTAEHMIRSKATSAHVYTSVEVDFENVERARKSEGKEFKATEGFSLTYLPFIVRALSEALVDFPNVNASIDGDNLVVHPDFHVGIAVDLDFKGLLVPAVRNAQGKRMRLIAQEIKDLATRAKNKQLRPDEVIGSTFTISNPGPLGTYMTMPIINQPQVAILATDGIVKRPVVIQDSTGADVIAIHHMGILTLGWDHRAFDGGYAAAFLAKVREVLQTRDWVAEI